MKATVAILTFNGDAYLAEMLGALARQQFDGEFEVLVIDSGSTDRTLQIVGEHPEVRLHQIPNSQFGHGRTRNLAAELSAGEFIAYLTHDAVPADDFWLTELLDPFSRFPGVEAVLGRQIPRADCVPILKYEINRVFAAQGPEFATAISYDTAAFDRHPQLGGPARFYSDVNSAARRRFLLEKIGYQDVFYAEDQLFVQDVLRAGHSKAYAPRGAVVHSNDLSYSEYSKRVFDEIVGLRTSGAAVPAASNIVRSFVRAMVLDPIGIVRDRDYSFGRKLYWLAVNPFFHLAKYRASHRARNIDLTNRPAIESGSLEHQRRAG